MKKLNSTQLDCVKGGAWWRDALDFGAGACSATAVYRSAAAVYSWAVPGGAGVWFGATVVCAAITYGAYRT